jgi:hypothetical protein
MRWPHTVRIERPGVRSVTQDQVTGRATIADGAAVMLYDGLGDMQHRRRSTVRDQENEKTSVADADVYLEDESNLWMIEEGATITVSDSDDDVLLKGKVLRIDRLSGMISVEQLNTRRQELAVRNEGGVATTSDDATVGLDGGVE